MVHQHFELVPRHTVLENLMVGSAGPGRAAVAQGSLPSGSRDRPGLSTSSSIPTAGRRAFRRRAAAGRDRQVADARGAHPGAGRADGTLTPQESEGLFRALRAMAGAGMGVIFISHKLGEVSGGDEPDHGDAAWRCGGGAAERRQPGQAELARLMCGRELRPPAKAAGGAWGAAAGARRRIDRGRGRMQLQIYRSRAGRRDRRHRRRFRKWGQRELADVIAGVLRPERGTIAVAGVTVADPSPRRMQALRIGRVPEDRMTTGMIGAMPAG
jgi:simple sugar transport system ATP-binding protein